MFILRKKKRSQTNGLSFHLKRSEKEQIKSEVKRKEIIKIRVEINKIQNQKTKGEKSPMKQKIASLKS